ncbi:hypothetical protein GETHLI_11720 [Geothrix limicola]|uniref:Uncharacterized protein n=1 Tax=Geothrix limicola TaxID=2927978 RepID=A0ABQ5QCU7_9BACT|nr:hypothetical protein [Geothrix limicola]GLH72670.1 hypothetical protein GETHLI_11720 [Geothrix limicola]
MDDFELHLTHALRRQEAPAGFADRVLLAARARRQRRWGWLAAASLALMILPAGYAYHVHTERQRAEAQLRLALSITSGKLNLAFKHLNAEPEQP